MAVYLTTQIYLLYECYFWLKCYQVDVAEINPKIMCTITYYPINKESYILASNRDELKTRARALPPRTDISNQTRFISPKDGDKGGTWIAVNEYKLSLCILNWFQAYDKDTDYKSEYYRTRGEIIHKLISSGSLSDCDSRLRKFPLEHYQPFRLLGFETNPLRVVQWSWDGRNLGFSEENIKPHLWISAGYEYDEVMHYRSGAFNHFLQNDSKITLKGIKNLHASEYPERGHYAISMSHEKASTVSNTIIDVRPEWPVMHYLDGFPAEAKNWLETELRISEKIHK